MSSEEIELAELKLASQLKDALSVLYGWPLERVEGTATELAFQVMRNGYTAPRFAQARPEVGQTPADASVDIPLPPEPPRTRVIEAVSASRGVVRTWRPREKWNASLWEDGGSYYTWPEVEFTAHSNGWTLRHRAAESGGES